jgi:hypothetical protein
MVRSPLDVSRLVDVAQTGAARYLVLVFVIFIELLKLEIIAKAIRLCVYELVHNCMKSLPVEIEVASYNPSFLFSFVATKCKYTS